MPDELWRVAAEEGERGCSCAEAVLIAYGREYGLEPGMAMKLAGGLGGGIGLSGETCGAVLAGVLVLGLRFGAEGVQDSFARQDTYIKVGDYLEEFKARHGSTLCRDLCGEGQMADAESARRLRASGEPTRMIQGAAMILDQML